MIWGLSKSKFIITRPPVEHFKILMLKSRPNNRKPNNGFKLSLEKFDDSAIIVADGHATGKLNLLKHVDNLCFLIWIGLLWWFYMTFIILFQGVTDVLCEACEALNWTKPTKIQTESIPIALQGKDIIGLAETGSGKTGAFALPILQAILETPQRLFALVLTPTRELAFQINEQFQALGSSFGLKSGKWSII